MASSSIRISSGLMPVFSNDQHLQLGTTMSDTLPETPLHVSAKMTHGLVLSQSSARAVCTIMYSKRAECGQIYHGDIQSERLRSSFP